MHIVLLIVVGILFFVLISRTGLGNKGSTFEATLRKRCHGDQTQVDRLINREMKRNPALSREQAAKDALSSLARDSS